MVKQFRIWKLVIVGLVLALFASTAPADEKQLARDREARAALALAASAKPTPAHAPTPRPAGPRDYAGGHAKALLDQLPLVVFVGCEPVRCEGAICSKASGDSFGATKAPAVVIGFPQGQTMYVDSTLPCPVTEAQLKKAVQNAAKKIDVPQQKSMPKAPVPADWRITADKPGCVCGDGCKCAPGDCPSRCPVQAVATTVNDGDGLDEVNAQRAARGLRPFLRDEGLTAAAKACAEFRAARLLFGHTSNDFAFCPPGAKCDATGCAAYPASYGWLSCCTYENWTRAGAAWALGRDGRRYMHLFVGHGAPALQAMPDPRQCQDCGEKNGQCIPTKTPLPIGNPPSPNHYWGFIPGAGWGWRLKSASDSGVIPQPDYRFVPHPLNQLYVSDAACSGST